ncbi:type I DNA topoisomerase [Candidatus Falkowbacteria bacterium]|nr:type I DNA topoisomerase [Candidatus Falkowbacteria bacterium]
MRLVIVESPTKAKTISKFLPAEYQVESSFGHVRDLPEGEMGVDIENNFEPKYVVGAKAKKHVDRLKKLAGRCDDILFATDADREGEAISWHLKEILKPKKHERIIFHEITKRAIEEAIETPRDIDMNLVNAQQARRVLDRLVGYELSPFLWKKVAKGLSAGRVQSVAVRLIVEREREIENFKKEEYWTIEACFDDGKTNFQATLHSLDGKALKKFDLTNAEQVAALIEKLKTQTYRVAKIETKDIAKKPPEPFRTSTLQQTANNRLGFSSKQTMKLAQELYEGVELGGKGQVGLITYMRTDSLNLSEQFLSSCHNYIKEKFGADYASVTPRRFKTKSKGAQEAHEAIRPTHANFSPDEIRQFLNDRQFKLYKLIWSRAVASQMKEAIISSTSVDINSEDGQYTFRANGQTIKFDGFLKVYPTNTKENLLPALKENQTLDAKDIKGEQHFTEPPARYTEATLIKVLEEYGIGRPSTYAPTIATIQERNYVVKKERQLEPTDMGKIVNDILVEHFSHIVDYKFTAEMEEDLDKIAEGKKKWQPIIKAFYTPFKSNLDKKSKELTKKELTEEKTDQTCEKCGSPMVIKTGRFGRFLACSNYPKCRNAKPLENGKAVEPELLEEKCPECGSALTKKRGRYGAFIGCSNYPNCKYIKNSGEQTNIVCPKCEIGKIVSRRGRRQGGTSRGGKVFYACDNYPKCKFILWGRPTGERCPTCDSLMIQKGEATVCGNADCATNKTRNA